MAISFIHAADIHLDSPLRGLERYENAPVERIRGATRRAFTRLIDLAVEKRVNFFLISGDLYDGDWRDYNTGLFLVQELRRLRDSRIPVFLIAGNHDAANKMTRSLPLPENVRFLAHNQPETVHLEELGVAIHGQSFARAAITENLAASYPAPVRGCVNIGLLHTAMNGADGHERYAPCTLDDLKSRGYDYWALGHVHIRQVLCNEPLVVFAGNVQGRHVRETGPKGCLLVTIKADHSIDPVFQRLDQVRWERTVVDASDLETESELMERTDALFDGLLASEPDIDVMLAVRVVFSGTTSLHGRLYAETERWVAEIRNLATEKGDDRLWIEKIELRVHPARALKMPEGPFEELQEVIEQLGSDPVAVKTVIDELAELKRKLPAELIHDFDGPRLDDAEWLRILLPQVQPMLLDLLRKSELSTAGGPDTR
jgi:DNA repair protein SbcD/Mre11